MKTILEDLFFKMRLIFASQLYLDINPLNASVALM